MKRKAWSVPLIISGSIALGVACISPFVHNRTNNINNKVLDTNVEQSLETRSNTAREILPGAPANLKALQDSKPEEVAKLSKYDSRYYGIVTPVKDQRSEGICWAYAGSSVAETNILRQGLLPVTQQPNFSPNYMDYATKKRDASFNVLDINRNDILTKPLFSAGAAAYCEGTYSRWAAPCYVEDYKQGYVESPFNLVNSEFFMDENDIDSYEPGFTEQHQKDRVNNVKLGIAKYGALTFDTSVQVYHLNHGSAEYYSNKNNYNGKSGHALTVIGWDDDIPGDMFGPVPASTPGGWLIKDSWGTNSHGSLNGYFWMSYESSFGSCIGYEFAKAHEEYDNNYHWDAGEPLNDQNNWAKKEAAAIFPVQKANFDTKEFLNAVNVSIVGRNTTVDVKVYNNVKGVDRLDPYRITTDPKKGDLVFETTQKFERGGTKTIKLGKDIPLTKGQYFSVVVKVSNPTNDALISLANDTSSDDMTYAYVDGAWRNFYNNKELSATARIRAFTREEKINDASSHSLADATVKLDKTNYRFGEEDKKPKPIEVKIGNQVLTSNDYDVIYQPLDLRKTANDVWSVKDYIGYGFITLKGKNRFDGEITLSYDVIVGMAPDIGPNGWYTADVKYPENYSVANIRLQDGWQTYKDIELPEGFVWERPNDRIDKTNPSPLTYEGVNNQYYRYTRFSPSSWTLQLYDKDEQIPDHNTEVTPTPPSYPQELPDESSEYNINNATIILEKDRYIYEGQPIYPKIKDIIRKDGIHSLIDQFIVRYENNDKPGIGKVIVKGDFDKTMYFGEKVVEFTILNKDGSMPEIPVEPEVHFDAVKINIDNPDIIDGDRVTATATVEGTNLKDVTYKWEIVDGSTQIESTSDSISFNADVNDNGKKLRVTATCQGQSMSSEVTLNISNRPVVTPEVTISSISFTLDKNLYNVGDNVHASANIYPNPIEGLGYQWTLDGIRIGSNSPTIDFKAQASHDRKTLRLVVTHKNNTKDYQTQLFVQQPQPEPQPLPPIVEDSSGSESIIPPSSNGGSSSHSDGSIINSSNSNNTSDSNGWDWWMYGLIGLGALLIIIGIIWAIIDKKKRSKEKHQPQPKMNMYQRPVNTEIKTIPVRTSSGTNNTYSNSPQFSDIRKQD